MERVLVVEDSAAVRAYIKATLASAGVTEVSEAATGFEALRLLPRGGFTLILADLNMPSMSGLEFVAFLRKNATYAKVPVVVVSTESRGVDRDKALALGADAFVVKPFLPETLLAALRPFRTAER
ncbi:MAG: response regulator [Deltaproteobacteria bacterium]|nr:response regulator [Deltaproteobacteria bacterium]